MRLSSRVIWLLALGTTLGWLADSADAQYLRQWSIGEKGCGPCAFMNSLIGAKDEATINAMQGDSATEKTRWFIREFGDEPSQKYREHRNCYTSKHGTADVDLKFMVNALRKNEESPPVVGDYVARKGYERSRSFVRRIHRRMKQSIESGFHPLMSVRALAAQLEEKEGDEDSSGEDDPQPAKSLVNKKRVWNSKGGHWIAVHAVGEITEDAGGFTMTFSDSLSGRRQTGHVYLDRHRPAIVPMEFTVDEDGKEQWEWVSNRECLMLNAPNMPIGTMEAEWYERTCIALRYLIYLEPSGEVVADEQQLFR